MAYAILPLVVLLRLLYWCGLMLLLFRSKILEKVLLRMICLISGSVSIRLKVLKLVWVVEVGWGWRWSKNGWRQWVGQWRSRVA
jgi:hypothetical protein